MHWSFNPAVPLTEKNFKGEVEIKTGKIAEMKISTKFICADGNAVDSKCQTESDKLPIIQ